MIRLQNIKTDMILSTTYSNTLESVDTYCITGENLLGFVGKYC